MSETCENCRWWGEKDTSLLMGVDARKCYHPKVSDSFGAGLGPDALFGDDGAYTFTGPDFGCIHWDARKE